MILLFQALGSLVQCLAKGITKFSEGFHWFLFSRIGFHRIKSAASSSFSHQWPASFGFEFAQFLGFLEVSMQLNVGNMLSPAYVEDASMEVAICAIHVFIHSSICDLRF